MGKSTPSAPPQTNPQNVAAQQAQANSETAITQAYLNNVNQQTPYGNLKYDVTGHQQVGANSVPTFTASQDLSPAGQKLLDTNTATTQGTADLARQYVDRIGTATSQPYSYDGLPAAPTYNEDYRKQQLGAIQERNQPQMDRDRQMLEQRLADQGVGMEDPAYKTAWDQHQRGVNDFRLGADVQAGNAAAQQYGLEGNTRDRAISEMSNLRSQPINEVSALMGTGGVQNPSFVPTPTTQVAPTDVTGAYRDAYSQQMAAYNAQMSQSNASTGGLFGLGGTLLGAGARYGLPGLFGGVGNAMTTGALGSGIPLSALALSDERAKEDIQPVGELDDGQTVYSYRYKGDPRTQIGLIAQEVERVHPEAVHTLPGGLKAVDYAAATRPRHLGGLFALGEMALAR